MGLLEILAKNWNNVHHLSILKFKPIEYNLPTVHTFSDQSTNQKYLLEIVQVVS